MKTTRILLVLTLISGIAYFALDRQLFYYGKNDFDFYQLLPLDIIPEDRPNFENGFALKDEFGFTIAAKGNTYKYHNKEIVIENILSYCYNFDKVVAKIADKNNEEFYIEFVSNKEKKTSQGITANIWDNNRIINTTEFKCINIKGDEKKINRLVYHRNHLIFIFITLIILSFYKTIKLFRNKS